MKSLKLLLLCLFCLVVFLGMSPNTSSAPLSQTQGTILFVKPSANGTCSSWTDACELQTALGNAITGNQIWVSAGMYKPTIDTNREAAFQLKSGVAVYGGFVGAETSLYDRNWVTNNTTLSGDIGIPDDNTDNSYHVVTGSELDKSTILDGFTISAGNASETSWPNFGGGGMLIEYSSPTLSHIIFSDNLAKEGGGIYIVRGGPILTHVTFDRNTADAGGGMISYQSRPILTNVTFSENSAGVGGGMDNESSSPTLTNVTFSENSADYAGGGMYGSGSLTLTNVTFSGNTAIFGGGISYIGGGIYNDSKLSMYHVTLFGNTATSKGGAIYNSGESTICFATNSILWGNIPDQVYNFYSLRTTIEYSVVQGGDTGTGNINEDPLLGPLADNGGFTQTHALGAGSSAIDTGKQRNYPNFDQRGYYRPIDGDGDGVAVRDRGAYEFGAIEQGFFTYLPLINR